jgi:hypothetical protein
MLDALVVHFVWTEKPWGPAGVIYHLSFTHTCCILHVLQSCLPTLMYNQTNETLGSFFSKCAGTILHHLPESFISVCILCPSSWWDVRPFGRWCRDSTKGRLRCEFFFFFFQAYMIAHSTNPSRAGRYIHSETTSLTRVGSDVVDGKVSKVWLILTTVAPGYYYASELHFLSIFLFWRMLMVFLCFVDSYKRARWCRFGSSSHTLCSKIYTNDRGRHIILQVNNILLLVYLPQIKFFTLYPSLSICFWPSADCCEKATVIHPNPLARHVQWLDSNIFYTRATITNYLSDGEHGSCKQPLQPLPFSSGIISGRCWLGFTFLKQTYAISCPGPRRGC